MSTTPGIPDRSPENEPAAPAPSVSQHRPTWMPRTSLLGDPFAPETDAGPNDPATGNAPGDGPVALAEPHLPPPAPPFGPSSTSTATITTTGTASTGTVQLAPPIPPAAPPPLAPPASAPYTIPGPPQPPSPDRPAPPAGPPRTPAWVVPFAILAALALFAGGAMAGWALSERNDSATPSAPVTRPTTDTPAGLVPSDAIEPVADVAQAVAPSVVQINTDFGLGSGVIMDEDGHILTAAHVIEGATTVRVRLASGTMVDGTVVGTHSETDVGVVKIEALSELIPATLGLDADVRVGQMAVAVGSPFGLEQSVTSGIVSALDRPINTEQTILVGMIQTDASINPGNSGGALADRQGRVIGINDAIRTQGGGNEGVGFAIPIDLAASVADRLISGEPIQMGFLGVVASSVFEGRAGALVQEVTAGTAADEAGIVPGDLIVSLNGLPIRDLGELRARVIAVRPGSEISLVVVRDGEELELSATIGSLD